MKLVVTTYGKGQVISSKTSEITMVIVDDP
jgi:hypothetical protein